MSTQPTPSPHESLRTLAEKAEPDVRRREWFVVEQPWLPSNCEPYIVAGSPDPHAGLYVCDLVDAATAGVEDEWSDEEWSSRNWAVAEYIAAANPQVILGLLDEIERLRADHRLVIRDALEDRTSSLEAKLREAEAQCAALIEGYRELEQSATAEVNEKGGGGFILARISDARRILSSPSAAASALVRRLAELEAQVNAINGPVTRETFKLLPPKLRAYIHDVETRADPAGDVQTIHSQREQIEYLTGALSAARQNARTWRRITSAPTDQWILLWNGHWRGVGKQQKIELDDPPNWHDEADEFITPPPTHWQPLPSPPDIGTASSLKGGGV